MQESSVDARQFATQLLNPNFAPQAFRRKGAAGRPQAHTRWLATDEALRTLGLRRGAQVSVGDLATVLTGRHTRTGRQVLPAGSIDLIFKAPNSVSVLWSQLPPERRAEIEDAMLGSAAAMLDLLTSEHPVVDGVRKAQSYVAALVLHAVGTRSARVGTIPPVLHVHGCLFGVLDWDGSLTEPDEMALSDEDTQLLCDAIGELALADRMIGLGYPVENTARSGSGHKFEVAGVPKELLEGDLWNNTGCAVAG